MDVTRRAWTCYWTHRAAHATVGILNALDDRALEDIGLSRSEIDSATHCCMFQETGIRGRGAASCGL